MKRQATSGVTLMELLIAVAVVAALASLLFPALRSLRTTAQAARCVNQLRTIYQVSLAFTQDHQGMLPVDLAKNNNTTSKVHPSYTINQYWWDTAYLGRYMLDQHDRSRYNVGKLRADEMGPYQCPARTVEGPDENWPLNNAQVTYVMVARPYTPANYRLMTMQDKSRRIYMTEGRWSTVRPTSARTGDFGDKDTAYRLRRFHNGGLNLLFLDGHIEAFHEKDGDLALMMQPES